MFVMGIFCGILNPIACHIDIRFLECLFVIVLQLVNTKTPIWKGSDAVKFRRGTSQMDVLNNIVALQIGRAHV